jgi:3-methylfumaryl-CoA hydratase|tara:strand:+ start:850 stop:1311 length:462 start_codon:yes stop_codon:yes gene_type:complete
VTLLTEEHLAWIGTSDEPVTVEVSRRDIQKYARATEQQLQEYLSGDEAPPMFVFNLFGEVCGPGDLRHDGLSRSADTHSGPRLPLNRYMAGGTELRFHRPIRPGDVLIGVRTLVEMFEKEGRSGPLIFIRRELAITTADGECVMEEIQTAIAR